MSHSPEDPNYNARPTKRGYANHRVANRIYCGIAYHFALYTSYVCLSLLLCPQTLAEKCSNRLNMFVVVMTSLNISGDFYLLFLPIFAVARLQIPTRFKLSLVAVFSTGLCRSSSKLFLRLPSVMFC